MAEKKSIELNYDEYKENENIQWFVHNIFNSESGRMEDGVTLNHGGFNESAGNSTAFGAGQFIGKTRQETLDTYGVDAWSKDINEQVNAMIALLHTDGDLDKIAGGDFEGVFGKSTLRKNKKGEMIGGSRWQAFYPEGHKDFVENNKNSTLFGPRGVGWQDKFKNQLETSVYDQEYSWKKIGSGKNGAKIQAEKTDTLKKYYPGLVENNYFPIAFPSNDVKIEDVKNVTNPSSPGAPTQSGSQPYNMNIDVSRNTFENPEAGTPNSQTQIDIQKALTKVSGLGDIEKEEVKVDEKKVEENKTQLGPTKESSEEININKEINKKRNTFNYDGLSSEIKKDHEARERAALNRLSTDAKRKPGQFFKSKDEYEAWVFDQAKKDPTKIFGLSSESKIIQSGLLRQINKRWEKYYGKDDGIIATKKYELKRLDIALEEIYNFDFDGNNEDIKDQMREKVLMQLNENDIDALNNIVIGTAGIDRALGGVAFTEERKEAIVTNARKMVYADQQEVMSSQYDGLTLEKDKITVKMNSLKERRADIDAESEDLKERRDKIFSEGSYEYNRVGNVSTKQWVPKNIREYVDLQADVGDFEEKAATYNSYADVFQIEADDYDAKVKEFQNRSENLQEALAYNVVDGQLVFDASFKTPAIVEWQESLRGVMGKDTFLAKSVDVALSFVKPVVGMAADITTFWYQGAIMGTAFAVDAISGNEGSRGNAEAIFDQMFMSGGSVGDRLSNLIPVSTAEDTKIFLGNDKVTGKPIYREREGGWGGNILTDKTSFKKSTDRTLYQYGKVGAQGLAYPFVLYKGFKKQAARNILNKSVKRNKKTGKVGSGNRFNDGKNLTPLSGKWVAQKLDKLSWKYLGIASSAGKSKFKLPGRGFMNSMNSNFKMTDKFMLNLNMTKLSYKMEFSQNVALGQSEGLGKGESFIFANFMSLVTGLSQSVMPDYAWFKTAGGKSLTKGVIAGLKQNAGKKISEISRGVANKTLIQTAVKNFAKEVLEEELDVIGKDLVRASFLENQSPEALEIATQEQLILSTMMMSGALGTKSVIQGYGQIDGSVVAGYRKYSNQILSTIGLEVQGIEEVLSNAYTAIETGNDSKYYRQIVKNSEARLDQLKKTELRALQISNALSASSSYVTDDQVNALVELQQYEAELAELTGKGQNKSLNKVKIEALKEKIKQQGIVIENSGIGQYQENIFNKLTEKAKNLTNALGGTFLKLDQEDFSQAVQVQNKIRQEKNDEIDKQIEEMPRSKKTGKLSKKNQAKKIELENQKLSLIDKNQESPGMIYYDDKTKKHVIVINSGAAVESFNFAVGMHEVFHAILRETMIKNPELMKKMAFVLKEELSTRMAYGDIQGAGNVLGKFQSYGDGKITNTQADELFTIMSEMIIEGDFNMSDTFFGKMKSIFRQISRDYIGKDIIIKDKEDLISFIEAYSKEAQRGRFSKSMDKVFENGLEDNFKLTKKQQERYDKGISKGEVTESLNQNKTSQSSFYDKKVVDDLGLSKETEKIVAENSRLRQLILDEGIEKDGKIVASPELQMELVSNNMGAAIKLGVFAAANPNIMGLEADKRVTADEFISGYYEQLTNLARTYDASNIEFGAYMNSLLPLRYGQILKEAKKGAVEGRVSIDSEEGKELTGDVNETKKEDDEKSKKVNIAKRLNVYEEAKKVMREGLRLIKSGPVKNKDGSLNKEAEEKRIARLQELGFADKNGVIVDIDSLTFAKMPNILYKVVAKVFGVDAYKLNPYEKLDKNLRRGKDSGTNEMLNAQLEILKISLEFFASILPEGHTRGYKTTGIAKTKFKIFYNKSSKRMGNDFPWFKKPIIDINMLAEMLGVVDNKSFREGRSNQQSVISYLNVLGSIMSNQMFREVMIEEGTMDQKLQSSLEDGLSKYSESRTFRKNVEKQNMMRDGLPAVSQLMYSRGLHLHGSKDFDKEVKEIFKEVYGDKLGRDSNNKNIRIEFANDLLGATGLLNQYGAMNKNANESGFQIQGLQKFLEENLREEYNDKQIFESLGLSHPDPKKKLTKDFFFTPTMMIRGRKHLHSILNSIELLVQERENDPEGKAGISEAQAYEWIFMLKNMYAGASRAGNGSYSFENGSFDAVKGTKVGGKQYAQVTSNAQDFFALVSSSDSRFKTGDTKFNNAIKKKYGIKNYEEKSKSVLDEILDGSFDFLKRKEQALRARELTKFVIVKSAERLKDPEDSYNKTDFAQLIYMFGSNMESPSRKSAYVYGLANNAFDLLGGDTSLAGELLEYDHAKPHHVAMLAILDIVNSSPVDMINDQIDIVFKDFVVNIIPKTMDKAIKAMGMQFQIQMGYQQGLELEDMLGIMGRIYSNKMFGDNRMVAITSLDGKKTKFGTKFENILRTKRSPSQTSKSVRFEKAQDMSNKMSESGKTRGISIWDFDDTLARSNSNVLFTAPDGKKGKLTAEEFAKVGADLLEQGYVYDFSEFSKVVDGKTGPFFNKALARAKKFGVKDQFILTARPENSAVAIYEFLKGVGLEIPLENITGLANSTPESKALWIVDKVAEGYNDIYFADDALQNVQVVKDVLDQFDVKSKVQLAKSSESASFDKKFNDIIERKKGIESSKRFSKVKGEKRGKSKGKFKFFIPPSAEDFMGLLYNFIGKGKQGEVDMAFFKKALIDPFAKAISLLNKAKQLVRNEYISLLKDNKRLRKLLTQKTPDGDFTYEDAIRVYLFTKSGYEIPGMSEADVKKLNDLVLNNYELLDFANEVGTISRVKEGYVKPEQGWAAGSIRYDLDKLGQDVRRENFLTEFRKNREAIFGVWSNGRLVGENMNKIEAAFGPDFREALSDMLWRMENGTNRSFGKNKMVNQFMNYINGSVATTMFFNARSALLQNLSMINFINWEDNNIFAAGKAFANQQQFWGDFIMLFNSDMLKQRRSGLGQDLNASELVSIVGKSRNKTLAAINYILSKGFLPTQIADSFAIAMGGASFYRNRTKKYISEGMSSQEAEKKAFLDFQEIAEATQQSSRPDMISQQQASPLGRLILAFANTPMQYTRIQKKAFLDLINGRGSAKANVSKIIYYGFLQNLLFTTLQSALFAMAFVDDEEDEEILDEKSGRIINSMLDTTLRGVGIYGAAVSTVKNMIRQFQKQDKKGRGGDYGYVLIEFFNLSPPIGIKARKIYSGLTTYKYNSRDIKEGDLKLGLEVGTSILEGMTNVPVSRIYNKISNLKEVLNEDHETWQRIAMFLGWSKWNLGIGNEQRNSKGKNRRNAKRREEAIKRSKTYY